MDPYPLTDEQIAFYRENGFIQLHNVLSAEELQLVRNALEDANKLSLDPTHHTSQLNPEYEKVFVQKVNLWRVHEGIRQYTLSWRLADIARRLAGFDAVRLWHDQALIKMPGDSKETAWHQDLPYWPMNEPGALSCWMALDDVTPENGCMQFIPGSHLWGIFEPIVLTGPQDLFALVPDADKRDFTPFVAAMPAGSCTFHDGRTFHYAGANRTDKPRRAMVTIYMADGTTFNGNSHVVTDGLGLQPGQPMDHEVFPLLASKVNS